MKKITSLVSKKLVLVIILIIAAAVAIGSILFYNYQKQKSLNPGAGAEIESLTKSIGKLIQLPAGEVPTVATVSDITKLADQPFFAEAKNGDKVLIFAKAKKAIIYRPSADKIIEVSSINLNNNDLNASKTSPVPTKASTVKIALYNGTKTAGLAKKEGEALKEKFPNLEIISTANTESNYTENLVIDLSGKNSEFVKTLAEELSGKTGSLPQGETKPDGADILIILGNAE